MNRKLLLVMMLTALVAAQGCRRERPKRDPILVQKESDFLYTRKADLIGAGLEPKPKTNLSPEEQKLAQAAAELARKLKDEADKIKRKNDTIAMGIFLLNYRTANSATLYSFNKLRTAMRRQGLFDMYDDLDRNQIEVVYLAESFNPNHIICYHKTAESQPDPADPKKTISLHPVIFGGDAARIGLLKAETIPFIRPEELPGRIRDQEMQVCWNYYVQYAIPHFYRAGPDFDAFKAALVRQGEPFFLPAPPPASLPPIFLGKLAQRKPDLLKNPPEPRTLDRFKKYLAENAPPQLQKLVEDNTLSVSMEVDLAAEGQIVAGRVAVDTTKDNVRTNQAIATNGQIASYPAAAMAPWLEKNRPPKK